MNELKRLIREVPDYPKPGILFYDLTTLLKDAPATEIINAIDTVMSGGVYYSEGLSKQPMPVMQLTPREKEILQRIATGKSNKHIARDLNVSFRTVETHRLNIKRKLGIEGQADLIRFALAQTVAR